MFIKFRISSTSHITTETELQGKNQLILEMWNHILTFQTKLKFWEFQIKQNNYTQFNKYIQSPTSKNYNYINIYIAISYNYIN